MDLNFRDRKQKIIAVDPAGASRALLTEVIRSLGFTDAQAVPSIRDALDILEVEAVTWLITPLFSDQNENLFQLLKLCSTVPELKDLRVSAFIEDSELDLMPGAFELGLLSFHRRPFTKDYLKSEFESIFSDFEKFHWDSSLLASTYLRKCLMSMGAYDELLAFERQLLQAKPGNIQQILNLAVPLIKTQKIEEAKAVLLQVQRLEPLLDKQVKVILETYLDNADLGDVKSNINVMGLKTVMIVDGDGAVQNDLKGILQELGVESIQTFSDGISALQFLEEGAKPDLIIQEWKLPKLTGPIFLQKAKDFGSHMPPFILYSNLIEKADVPFLREMGIAHLIVKPAQRKELIKNIIWVIQQDRSPTEKAVLERKIRQALSVQDFPQANALSQKYLRDPSIALAAKQMIEAELAYAGAKYETSRDFAMESIKNGGESIFLLNLLGKSMLQLQDIPTALRCFQKAQQLAPLNLERLCQMAELEADLGNNGQAEAALTQVDELDPDNEKAKESRAKIAIKKGDSKTARQILSQLRITENVVSYMNNLAVAMARSGKVEAGIDQYRKTLQAIPENRSDVLAIVKFNMAFAFLRAGMLDEAKQYLGEVSRDPAPKMRKRAMDLLKRVRVAQAKGLPIHISEGKSTTGTPHASLAEHGDKEESSQAMLSNSRSILAALESQAGERACFRIYHCQLRNPLLAKLLAGDLHFVLRDAIQRGESRGADKLNAAAS